MNQLDIDFVAAARRRDTGMASSSAHAEQDAPGWGEQALALLTQYAWQQSAPWTTERFRSWAYTMGLPQPADERAFGSVTQKALRYGVIERVGYAPAASSNGSPKPTYRSVP